MKICPNCKAEYAGGEVFCPVDATRLSTHSQLTDGSPTSSDDPLIGVTLSERYKILRQIGEGGMGIVYEAQHVVIEKQVALKILRDDFSRRPEVVERFRQEAKSASRIGHENIVDISDFGETPSRQSYFVMEYLEGEDLANVLSREGTVPAGRAVNVVLQCCKALGAAHNKGIVHRDMKPENIFLIGRDGHDDFVKIVDFGIAKMSDIETVGAPGRKLTKTGMIFGTPEYMSPEQAAGKGLDHRVDVYALGVILFEMLAGRVPFLGDTFMGILTQHMFEEVPTIRSINPRVSCPPELERVIQRALAKTPAERYESMAELGRALSNAMDMSGIAFDVAEPPRVTVSRGPRILVTEASPTAEFGVGPTARGSSAFLVMGASALALVGVVAVAYLAISGTTMADGEAVTVASEPVDRNGAEVLTAVDPLPSGAGAASSVIGGDDDEPEPIGPTDSGQQETATVTLTVHTIPAGASVMVDGKGTVCPRSPCSFETPRGEDIMIRARRGSATASRELRPDETMTLEMALIRRPRERPSGDGRTGGAMASDLKTPEIFR